MSLEITKGVQLHVLTTNKYKTVRIMIRFATRLDEKTITKRTLLASLLETNCQRYPEQVQISEKLAELYGASFGINVTKKGNQHYLTLTFNLVNSKYLLDKPALIQEAAAFLREIIFAPNIQAGQFEEQTFAREKTNIEEYIESAFDDKQIYAALALQEVYFANNPAQRIPSFGTVEALKKETAATMAKYYETMLREDLVDIMVIGDVTEAELFPLFESLPFTPRTADYPEFFYDQPLQNLIREKTERQSVIQSKLNIGYYTGIYAYEQDYFPLQVFNGIFGGFAHSKLFMNVREKHSMAYYASSSIDVFRGMLTVQTGIDGKNRDKVLTLVEEQLMAIEKGQVSSEEIEQTKAMLRNQYLLGLDNPGNSLEKAYVELQLPEARLTSKEWIQKLEAVNLADIQKVADQIHKQAIFFLEGGMD